MLAVGRINYVGQPTTADGSDVFAEVAVQCALALEKAMARLEDEEEDAEDAIEEALEAALDAEMGDYDEEVEDEEEEEMVAVGELVDASLMNAVAAALKHAEEGVPAAKRARAQRVTAGPLNFSRVDTSLPEEELHKQFPLYCAARARRVEVTVTAGQMLFIPAGWFHEVRSVAASTEGHMALNYWFHPPDTKSFEKPYSSVFWSHDWSERQLEKKC